MRALRHLSLSLGPRSAPLDPPPLELPSRSPDREELRQELELPEPKLPLEPLDRKPPLPPLELRDPPQLPLELPKEPPVLCAAEDPGASTTLASTVRSASRRRSTRAVWHTPEQPVADLFHRAFFLVVWLFMSAIFAVFVTIGLYLFVLDVPEPLPLPEPLVRARMDEEQRVAESIGFVLERREPLRDRDVELSLELRTDECVALIAGAWGSHRVTSVVVVPERRASPAAYDPRAVGAHPDVEGVVGHAQLCPDVDGTGTARVQSWSRGDHAVLTGGELRVLRAPRERVGAALNRGWTLPRARRDAGRDAGPTDGGAP